MTHRVMRVLMSIAVALALVQPALGHADLIDAVNAYRASLGLVALTPTAQLEDLAHQRAVEVASDFNHVDLTGRLGCWQWGENIAWVTEGYGTAEYFLNAWVNSPSHDAVLRGNWAQIGAGAYNAGGRTYAVMVVLRPCSAPEGPDEPEPVPLPGVVPPVPIADEIPDTNMLGE